MARITLDLFGQAELPEDLNPWNVPQREPEYAGLTADMPLKKLSSRHQMMQDLELAGLSRAEIAQILGITPEWVTRIRASNLYQAGLQQKRAAQTRETSELIQNLALEAVIGMRDLARHGRTERIRFAARKWLAENAGHKAPDIKEINVNYKDTVEQARILAEQRRRTIETTATHKPDATSSSDVSDVSEDNSIPSEDDLIALEQKFGDEIEDYAIDYKGNENESAVEKGRFDPLALLERMEKDIAAYRRDE